MPTFIALYQGQTISDAQIVAVTAQSDIVQRFAAELLNTATYAQDVSPDPVVSAVIDGKRRALGIVAGKEAIR